ncbi:MAG TPA: 50S ribosomal protein L15 [Candidatus Gracilibacteria bacterium]
MKINELTPKHKKVARKRRGQGNATGNGTFGGRGSKGQNARAGGGVRPGFEGGQTPLIQRMPKNKGFRNPNRVESQEISLSDLDAAYKDGEKVSFESLFEKGLIKSGKSDKVKILGNGALKAKIEVESYILMSASARTAIEKAGGKIVVDKAEA